MGGRAAKRAIVFDAYGTLFDVRSLDTQLEKVYPGKGKDIGLLWRRKQLEYTWLMAAMEAYEDFMILTKKALCFTLKTLRLTFSNEDVRRLSEFYSRLEPFKDVKKGLEPLKDCPKLILSNGTQDMLEDLVSNAGLRGLFDAVLSVNAAGAYKPSQKAYTLVSQCLRADPMSFVMVSSNPFDIAGAKNYGMSTVWLRRCELVMDELFYPPDRTLDSLLSLKEAWGLCS